MKDDRLRVTLEQPYATALGVALFCFARMEWDAIYCCERMNVGYINSLGRKTAGVIATDLISLAETRSDWPKFESRCLEFKRLVVTRNELLHGKPVSWGPANEQRLIHNGAPWTIEAVDDAADAFTACQIELNDFLHNTLTAAAPQP